YNLFMPDDRLQNTINELIEMAHEAVQDLDWESVKKFSEDALALDDSNEEAKNLSDFADEMRGSPTQTPKPSSSQNKWQETFSEAENLSGTQPEIVEPTPTQAVKVPINKETPDEDESTGDTSSEKSLLRKIMRPMPHIIFVLAILFIVNYCRNNSIEDIAENLENLSRTQTPPIPPQFGNVEDINIDMSDYDVLKEAEMNYIGGCTGSSKYVTKDVEVEVSKIKQALNVTDREWLVHCECTWDYLVNNKGYNADKLNERLDKIKEYVLAEDEIISEDDLEESIEICLTKHFGG
ncbi:hypothetical protein M1N55_06575, partial [Dehalococcoidia bacterium]|nr:hypothetical protein [Dehalococcoidia bacterium]